MEVDELLIKDVVKDCLDAIAVMSEMTSGMTEIPKELLNAVNSIIRLLTVLEEAIGK